MVSSILDSSVWVALYLDFDSNHQKAKTIFSKIKGNLVITNLILEEVATVLTYKHSREQSDNFINFVISSSDVDFIDYEFDSLLNFHLKHKHKISLTDSSLLFISNKLKVELISFDKQLVSLSKTKTT